MVHSDLESLLQLQERDRVVLGIKDELKALEPERFELDEALGEVTSALDAAKRRVEETAKRREVLEGKIESYRVIQERRRQKLEWVRGAKEASAVMAEIDLARSVLAKEESEWIRSADEVQVAEKQVEQLETKLADVREEQAGRRKELAKIESGCTKRLAVANAEREAVAKTINSRLRSVYERVLRGRATFALYVLRDGACGNCFTSIPLHVVQQMQHHQNSSTCEACGVMMYLDEQLA